MRANAKVDREHRQILDHLERRGFSTLSLAPLGRGAPDAIVASSIDTVHLLEIKTPGGRTSAAVGERQAKFRARWKGCVHVVYGKLDADRVLQLCEQEYRDASR